MKLRIKVLVFAYLCVSSINCKSASLQQVLSAYCVPTNSYTCSGSSARATFVGGNISPAEAVKQNFCRCDVEDYYYNKSARTCQLCEDGTYNRNNLADSCIKIECPVGTVLMKVNTCPQGTFKTSNF